MDDDASGSRSRTRGRAATDVASAGRTPAIERRELPDDTIALARFLIGKRLVRESSDGPLGGRIVETEAYPVGDAAAHAYRGRTARNASMFLEKGHAYVYLAYGLSYLLNVSSEAAGTGAGVLIRAIVPLVGIDAMRRNRGGVAMRDLTRGPGRVAAALAIDLRFDGVDLCRAGPLCLAHDDGAAPEIGVSTRIGLSRAADRPLRFYARREPFVSGPRALSP